MKELLQRINPSETEEFNKNLVAEFFNNTLYSDNQYMVNTYQRTDLAIYSNEHPVVLFEFKKLFQHIFLLFIFYSYITAIICLRK